MAATSGCLSQNHGTAGACSTTILSMSPHALSRAAPCGSLAAASIAALIFGSLSCDQFELPAGRMFLPLNTGSSIDCGSLKSLTNPTFGQMTTFAFGTLQNFVYSVSWGTIRKLSLKPSFSNWAAATSALFLPGSALVPTMRNFSLPVYLPVEYVAAIAGTARASPARPNSRTRRAVLMSKSMRTIRRCVK